MESPAKSDLIATHLVNCPEHNNQQRYPDHHNNIDWEHGPIVHDVTICWGAQDRWEANQAISKTSRSSVNALQYWIWLSSDGKINHWCYYWYQWNQEACYHTCSINTLHLQRILERSCVIGEHHLPKHNRCMNYPPDCYLQKGVDEGYP